MKEYKTNKEIIKEINNLPEVKSFKKRLLGVYIRLVIIYLCGLTAGAVIFREGVIIHSSFETLIIAILAITGGLSMSGVLKKIK